MITINEDVTVRLKERLNKIWAAYGRTGSKVETFDLFVNKILTNYLNKKDKEEIENSKQNIGIPWQLFRRRHFKEVYLRDNKQCQYCKKQLTIKQSTLDHIVSPLRGGLNKLENVCISCSWCNNDKGILTAEEYFYKQLVNKSKGIEPPK